MLLPLAASPRLSSPSRSEGMSTIVVDVENMSGDPIPRAFVYLTVNGVRIDERGVKTAMDATGTTAQVVFSFPTTRAQPAGSKTRRGLSSFSIVVSRGNLAATESGLIKLNERRHFLIILEPRAGASGSTAALRYSKRKDFPLAGRTQEEVNADLMYSANVLSKFIKATELIVHGAHESQEHHLKALQKSLMDLRSQLASGKRLDQADELVRAARRSHQKLGVYTKAAKIVTPAAVALTVLTGLYDAMDAIKNNDPDKLKLSLGNTALGLLGIKFPVVGAFYLGLHLGFWLSPKMVENPLLDAANAADGVARQASLPKLNAVGPCPAFKGGNQYRLRKEGDSWSVVPIPGRTPIVPGLAFDERETYNGVRVMGGLILVLSSGKRVMLPVRRMKQHDLDYLYDSIKASTAGL